MKRSPSVILCIDVHARFNHRPYNFDMIPSRGEVQRRMSVLISFIDILRKNFLCFGMFEKKPTRFLYTKFFINVLGNISEYFGKMTPC